MVKKKRKVQMPSSIRKKMMAATSMLLVSAILMVTTSYAWFTLSTAPEVTGITTSVGANGNLEMALLTTETFANTELITSNTGDSMEAADNTAVGANVTWGNLVDLSNVSYGLNTIKLYPAALNATVADEVATIGTEPLSTPTYGSDGRVNKLEPNTISAIYNVSDDGSAFTYSSDAPTYGVRAVGTASSVTPRELAFKSAKGTYNAKVAGVPAPMKSAVAANKMALIGLATSGDSKTSFSASEVNAMIAIAKGVQSSLKNIVSAYANAGLAKAASSTNVTDEQVEALRGFIGTSTEASDIKDKLNIAGITEYDTILSNLATAQSDVAGAIEAEISTDENGVYAADEVKTKLMQPLLGNPIGKAIYDEEFNDIPVENALSAKYVSLTGGAVKTVADYIGVVDLITEMGITVTAGDKKTGEVGELATLTKEINEELQSPSGDNDAPTNITDTYGYILDFAFRTNAAGSNLQLQTAAMNRVYSDAEGADLATQGAGSVVTLEYPNNEVTAEQAQNLLDAVRLVFFDPEVGTVYKTAMISEVNAGETAATGSIYIIESQDTKWTLGKDAYTKQETEVTDDASGETTKEVKYIVKTTLTVGGNEVTLALDNCTNYYAELNETQYNALRNATVSTTINEAAADKTAITTLDQNVPKKISVLVYLDGNNIDNAAVANGENSGKLKVNLQFSSSAELDPMENSALKNMEKTTTPESP